jgi:hypothetical protein
LPVKRVAGMGGDFISEPGLYFLERCLPVVGNVIHPINRNRKSYICYLPFAI